MNGYDEDATIQTIILCEIRDIKTEVTAQGKDVSAIKERVISVEKHVEEIKTSRFKVRMAITAATLSLLCSLIIVIVLAL